MWSPPDEKLPPGWTAHASRITGMTYYVNNYNLTSQWAKPQRPASAYNSGRIRCVHLLVKHAASLNPTSWREDKVTRTKDEAMELIREYRQRIVDGKDTLQELAGVFSDCSTSTRNGDLGYFVPGKMWRAFDDVAFKMEIGDLSEPVDTLSGIHLICRIA